jgi:hypothetical protein
MTAGVSYPRSTLHPTSGAVTAFVLRFVAGLWLGREEVGVGNAQFPRAMIPHHSRSILVCQDASITDPESKEPCAGIIASQQKEIDQMRRIPGERQGQRSAPRGRWRGGEDIPARPAATAGPHP